MPRAAVWARLPIVCFCLGLVVGCGDDMGGAAVPCVPVAEFCDGTDNDCDERIDEDQPMMTCGAGACTNSTPLCIDGQVQTCEPLLVATDEVCDSLDNDCDRRVDERMGRTTCGVGACRKSVDNCVGGQPQICDPDEGRSEEVCDRSDNDCDGQVDELGELTCGLGPCRTTVPACRGGAPQVCEPLPIGSDERCDRLDNDCDGSVDEEFLAIDQPCRIGVGRCESEGTFTCGVDGDLVCDAVAGVPFTESCNGLDDDCDGELDEGNGTTPLREACYDGPPATLGAGLCQAGWRTCGSSLCLGQRLPEWDVPDGADNDCDGRTDEGAIPTGAIALSGSDFTPGASPQLRELVCMHEARHDVASVLTDLWPDELCDNGGDDDCDGLSDETVCRSCQGAECSAAPAECVTVLAELAEELTDRENLAMRQCLLGLSDCAADQGSGCDEEAGHCSDDSECRANRACRDGRCREIVSCSVSADCPPRSQCTADGICKTDGLVEIGIVWMDQANVTVGQFAMCVMDGACDASLVSWTTTADDPLCHYDQDELLTCVDAASLPMNCVSPQAAEAYCRFAGGRLPHEIEWERAAAGLGCLTDTECADGEICMFGDCRRNTTSCDACQTGEVCVGNVCVRRNRLRGPYSWGAAQPTCRTAWMALSDCNDAMPTSLPPATVCPGVERLAWRSSSWQCVDPTTCRPFGQDACNADEDCDRGRVCCASDDPDCGDAIARVCACPAEDVCGGCREPGGAGCGTGWPLLATEPDPDRSPTNLLGLSSGIRQWVRTEDGYAIRAGAWTDTRPTSVAIWRSVPAGVADVPFDVGWRCVRGVGLAPGAP